MTPPAVNQSGCSNYSGFFLTLMIFGTSDKVDKAAQTPLCLWHCTSPADYHLCSSTRFKEPLKSFGSAGQEQQCPTYESFQWNSSFISRLFFRPSLISPIICLIRPIISNRLVCCSSEPSPASSTHLGFLGLRLIPWPRPHQSRSLSLAPVTRLICTISRLKPQFVFLFWHILGQTLSLQSSQMDPLYMNIPSVEPCRAA